MQQFTGKVHDMHVPTALRCILNTVHSLVMCALIVINCASVVMLAESGFLVPDFKNAIVRGTGMKGLMLVPPAGKGVYYTGTG